MYRMTDPDLYRMTDLIDLTGFSRTAIEHYRRRRILPPPVGGRAHARYTPLHLRILKDLRDRKDQNVTLDEMALNVQTRYPSVFPPHERHRDLGT